MNRLRGATLLELLVAIGLMAIPVGVAFQIMRMGQRESNDRMREGSALDSAFLERAKSRGSLRAYYEGRRLDQGGLPVIEATPGR